MVAKITQILAGGGVFFFLPYKAPNKLHNIIATITNTNKQTNKEYLGKVCSNSDTFPIKNNCGSKANFDSLGCTDVNTRALLETR